MEKYILKYTGILLFVGLLLPLASCEEDLSDPALEAESTLALSASATDLELREASFESTLDFNWTPGTNQKTGAAISYTLEMDLATGDFSDPIATFVSQVRNTYSFKIAQGDLNNLLLEEGLVPGEAYGLQLRLTAEVSHASVADQVAMGDIQVIPFAPVARELYLVGDAAPNGWDIGNASPLQASPTQRGVFVYVGKLSLGNFKFAVSQEGCWCQDFYTRDPGDANALVHNLGGSGEDLQWTIGTELELEQNYKLTVNLLDLSLKVEIVAAEAVDPPFTELWIVGDASASGWDVDNPLPFVQSTKDPFLFSYEGMFAPGNFKILAGFLGDWCGEWYRPLSDDHALLDGEAVQNAGCDGDTRWIVEAATQGRYKVTVNTKNNTIRFQRISLYLVGDGGPNGWNINDPEPMQDLGGGVYTYTGPLGAENPVGEFKISKFSGNWCDGDWINSATEAQSLINTAFILTEGCDGPDNKWKLKEGDAGNYEITVDLEAGTLSIEKL